MNEEQRRRLIAQLNGRTQMAAFEAAKLIWNEPHVRLEYPLLETLRYGRRPFNRAAAAYAMQILTTRRTIEALERTVANKSENPRVRGEAAEALAHRHRKKSHDVLLKALGDPSKDVRFWCAFSLGQMAERKTIMALKRLAVTDKRVVRGFWPVAKEATDALRNIDNGNRLRRLKTGCAFCIRGSGQ